MMEGQKQIFLSEILNERPIEADKVNTVETPPKGLNPGRSNPPKTATSRMTSLKAILQGVQSDERKWPQEAFRLILERFERMPRGGWNLAQEVFCTKFRTSISPLDFKRRAREAIVSKNGNPCSIKEYIRNPVKCENTQNVFEDQQSLKEAAIYHEIKERFLMKINELQGLKINEVERTRKIPSSKVDKTLLSVLNRVVGEYASTHQPKSMSDIARILQAVQLCYQDASTRPRKQSEWRANIEAKIQQKSASIALLRMRNASAKLSEEEKKAARKVMREFGLILDKPKDVTKAASLLEESLQVYRKKLQMHDSRREFRRENQFFELNRRMFYRQLTEGSKVPHEVSTESIRDFWSTMWNERGIDDSVFSDYLVEHLPVSADLVTFPTEEEFQNTIKYLPNWKAAGIDGIYNFFIKKISSLHSALYEVVKSICLSGQEEDGWFYKGITYLIPKGTPTRGSDFRPITCMSNLYKLTTKCVTQVMTLEVEGRGLLAENQLGTVRRVQGAKEQALLNICINKEHGNMLKAMWIDVKKAFDSVNHGYLIECIEKLNLPAWITKFLQKTISKWELEIRSGSEKIIDKKVNRGIIQGDSLSPLLFVLCMDPLSRRLNEKYPKVPVETEGEHHTTNHLLFIDDLKILAKSDDVLAQMVQEAKTFLNTIGLELNREKSATNTASCAEDGEVLDGTKGYKYLGIIEDSTGRPTKETLAKIKMELTARAERLCKTKLNAKNLFKALNEHALSLVNYHIGVLRLEPEDFSHIDHEIRQILIRHKVHMQPACRERLYLPRAEMGRGLHNIEHKSEQMLLQLKSTLVRHQHTSTRRAAILKVEMDNQTHLSKIEDYLKIKYGIGEDLTDKLLGAAQKESLYSEIAKKKLHGKLYRARANPIVSLKDSSTWLLRGNIRPRDEASCCNLQDRNMFLGAITKCNHCNNAPKTVDHLASKCDRMLSHDYTRRHNEVVRCLHLLLCNKYGIKTSKRVRSHSIQETVANENAEIRVDTRIKTDTKVQNNRPDLFVLDKRRNEILLVEVGITNLDLLQSVEVEKSRKYDLLANELSLIYKCRVRIVPYVMTWDGVVTTYHKKYMKELGVSEMIEAYVQSRVLKKTLESLSFDQRRGQRNSDMEGTEATTMETEVKDTFERYLKIY